MEEKLITAIAEIFEIDPSEVKPEDKFRDYENYSSLVELSVLALMNSEFDIELEMKDFDKLLTIKDLLLYIESHKP